MRFPQSYLSAWAWLPPCGRDPCPPGPSLQIQPDSRSPSIREGGPETGTVSLPLPSKAHFPASHCLPQEMVHPGLMDNENVRPLLFPLGKRSYPVVPHNDHIRTYRTCSSVRDVLAGVGWSGGEVFLGHTQASWIPWPPPCVRRGCGYRSIERKVLQTAKAPVNASCPQWGLGVWLL